MVNITALLEALEASKALEPDKCQGGEVIAYSCRGPSMATYGRMLAATWITGREIQLVKGPSLALALLLPPF